MHQEENLKDLVHFSKEYKYLTTEYDGYKYYQTLGLKYIKNGVALNYTLAQKDWDS